MIKEADHQGGRVTHPTAFPAFLEIYCNLHVAMKPTWILVYESEIKLLLLLLDLTLLACSQSLLHSGKTWRMQVVISLSLEHWKPKEASQMPILYGFLIVHLQTYRFK